MVSRINPQRYSILLIIFIVILWNVLLRFYESSFLLFLFILLIGIILASFRFKLSIETNRLVYQISFFNLTFIKREIYPEQMEQMKMIRTGWAKKSAIVKVNRGLSIRLAVLEPEEAYEHLLEFAYDNNITVVKTKDYEILERMSHNKINKG